MNCFTITYLQGERTTQKFHKAMTICSPGGFHQINLEHSFLMGFHHGDRQQSAPMSSTCRRPRARGSSTDLAAPSIPTQPRPGDFQHFPPVDSSSRLYWSSTSLLEPSLIQDPAPVYTYLHSPQDNPCHVQYPTNVIRPISYLAALCSLTPLVRGVCTSGGQVASPEPHANL